MPETIKLQEKLLDTVDDLLQNMARPGPTFFQLNFFVIGKEPTLQAKMHRCLQEIKERRNAIKSVELEIDELQDVNSLHALDLKRANKRFQAEEREIRSRQIKRKMTANETQIETLRGKVEAWTEEIKFLKNLYDQMAEHVELKSWDDYDVQLEYWSEKMSQEIKSRLVLNAPVDIEVIKTAMALPDQAPIKRQLLEHVEKIEKKQIANK